MKMITGAILILAGTVLFSAWWIGKVLHMSIMTGDPGSGFPQSGETQAFSVNWNER